MFLHSPPWQLPWESSHSSTSAGSQGSKTAYGSTSKDRNRWGALRRARPLPGESGPRQASAPCAAAQLAREPLGSSVTAAPSAGLLRLTTRCPRGRSASARNPGLGRPNPLPSPWLRAQILRRSDGTTNENSVKETDAENPRSQKLGA